MDKTLWLTFLGHPVYHFIRRETITSTGQDLVNVGYYVRATVPMSLEFRPSHISAVIIAYFRLLD